MSNKARKAQRKAQHSTADKLAYPRQDVIAWCMEVNRRLLAYANKIERKNFALAIEYTDLADNAALWAEWCKHAPISEFNKQCAYWASCE